MNTAFLWKLRWIGFIEGVSTLALFGVAMPLKYLADMPLAVTIAGAIHGALFTILAVMFARAIEEVLTAVRTGGEGPFTLDELVNTSRVTFAIGESVRSGLPVEIPKDASGRQK